MYNKKRTFNFRDETTILDQMRMYSTYSSDFQPFVDELTKLFDFTVASLQWDPAVRAKLREERRPAFSYNIIRTILNVIFSIDRDNRKKGKATPRTGGDNELANVITQTLDYYMYKAKFSKAQQKVFMDKIVARLGVYHVGWKYEGTEDDQGSLFVESADPREFIFEPLYNDPLWERSSFIMRKHKLSFEEILNQFALNDTEMEEAIREEASIFYEQGSGKDKWISKKVKAFLSAVYETTTSNPSSYNNQGIWYDNNSGKFDVLELHEKRTERRIYVPQDNKIIDLTEAYWSDYRVLNEGKEPDGIRFNNEIIDRVKERYGLVGEARADLMPRRHVTIVIPTFMMKVSEQAYPVDSKYYVYIPDYCYDFHADPLKVQSVMDDLMDPQADFNKARSLMLELLGRYANKGWIMDENAIAGLEEDWKSNRIAPYKRVRAGYIGMIKPEEGQVISPDLIRMQGETQQLMKVISNADDELRGNRSTGVTSGKHFEAKEQRQVKSYSYILENRDNAQKAVYELSLDFVQTYVTTQTIVRITQDVSDQVEGDAPSEVVVNQSEYTMENGQIAEKVLNDLDAEKYDIEIDDEPYSGSAQEERKQELGEIYNAAAAINPERANAMLPIIVEAHNTPESLKILTAWKELEQPQPEQVELQKLMIAVQQIMAKLGVEREKTEIEGVKLDNAEKLQRIRNNQTSNVLQNLQGVQALKNNTNGKSKKPQPTN